MELLVEYSSRFKEVPPEVASRPFSDDHMVRGCESKAYVWATPLGDGSYKYHFAVENPQGLSAKALAVILDETLSGEPAENIANVDPDMVYEIFGRGITMGRGQGLMGMVLMVKKLSGSPQHYST
jgi:cysteine desulfuration protein SufE